MIIYFNGWFSGFFNKENPGINVDFFLQLFEKIYNKKCEIGNIHNSTILCEFDTLINCCSCVKFKNWKTTYLFSGESKICCEKSLYDIVLCGERNYKNIVNVPLFIPYIYTNNFVNKLCEFKKINVIPKKNICVIISNPEGFVRNQFLNELEKVVEIDYAGSYKNNIGEYLFKFKYNSEEFLNFIKDYKFIVSMENSIQDTYITEKIIHGLLANIIPIYWGSNRIFDYFNKKRIINLNTINDISFIINQILIILNDDTKWLEIVNENNFNNNFLERNIDEIAKDIRCIINKECWNYINKIYCINNVIYEPDRNFILKQMFSKFFINDDYIKYISPTYKYTINENTYNKYTKNQLVRYLRNSKMSYGELSLFLNYRSVLEDIEKNYKDGMFLIFESDVMESKDIYKFNDFLNFIKDKEFDLIHLGLFDNSIFKKPLSDTFITGYRLHNEKFNNDLIEYENKFTNTKTYIEDITNEFDKFRVIRKFNTRCTDTFLWKYSGIVKFLNFMRIFEDYSVPFDYYMCNCFEKNLNIKHYWSVNEFFIQGSNIGLISSTLKNDREC